LFYVQTVLSEDAIASFVEPDAPFVDGWRQSRDMQFVVRRMNEVSIAICAESYGVSTNLRVHFDMNSDDFLAGRTSMLAAVWRIVAATHGDLLLTAPDGGAMLWRYKGVGVINADVVGDSSVGHVADGWIRGGAADVPPSVPFPAELT